MLKLKYLFILKTNIVAFNLESEERPIDLKDIRSSANVTQQFMCDLLGISLSYYRKMEKGERAVTSEMEEK
ncbi:helix-turn-helix domain-containing protein [Lactococcus lactis]